jgi:hypothetical protein
VPSVTLSPRAGMVTDVGIEGRSPQVGVVVLGVEREGRRGQLCACSGLPARTSAASPSASLSVGCGWISWATSSGSASQL